MVAEKKLKSLVKMIDNNEEMWKFDGKNFIPITYKHGIDDITFAELEFVILDLKTFGVEILEDEEETDIKMLEQEWFDSYEGIISVPGIDLAVKMNELIDKVNKLDKKINKE